jgi:hypothetical protein
LAIKHFAALADFFPGQARKRAKSWISFYQAGGIDEACR